MKPRFLIKTLLGLTVAAAALAAPFMQAQQPPAAPATDGALPAGVIPGSPLADVVKMLQAGVNVETIRTYIQTSASAFNLDADKILFLKDEGAPSDLINAMLDRDKALYSSTVAPAPTPAPAGPVPMPAPVGPAPMPDTAPAPAPDTPVVSTPDIAPPPTEVTADSFNTELTPYGSWVDVAGYGRCWRPTVVIYDSGWSPYGDRGHWVYTDYGWYWDSDYAWGITFHYGRWFRHPGLGWVWYPDTVWAPSWVVWRSNSDYCGWAPLPPFAVYRPGLGFYYRGASVGLDFDFGLGAEAFIFVGPDHFCDRHPRSFAVPRDRVPTVFHRTTIVNDFAVNGRNIVNRGFGAERIANATHRPIQPIHVGSLPNAGRQGWQGPVPQHAAPHSAVQNNFGRTAAPAPSRPGPTTGGQPATHMTEFNRPAAANPQPAGENRYQSSASVPPKAAAPQWSQPAAPHPSVPQTPVPSTATHYPAPQPSPAPRTYGEPSHAPSQGQWQQASGVGTAANGGSQQHGAIQLQQREFANAAEPPRANTPAPAPAAHNGGTQPANSGNGSQPNNGNGSGNRNSNRQNQ